MKRYIVTAALCLGFVHADTSFGAGNESTPDATPSAASNLQVSADDISYGTTRSIAVDMSVGGQPGLSHAESLLGDTSESVALEPKGGGACCTDSGCVMNLPEMVCQLMYGADHWYPGEVCEENGGDFECPSSDLFACCGQYGCEMATEQECVDSYGEDAWHPGEDCATVECPVATGACCADDGELCVTVTEEDCYDLYDGDAWYFGETCADDGGDFVCPVETGACCSDEGCLDTTQEDCEDLVGLGRWFRNVSCSDENFHCPEESIDSLFWQFPSSGVPGNSLYVSDASWPFFRYERFWDLNGDICGVRWIGWMANRDSFMPCEVESFIIRFYSLGDDLRPGAEVAVEYVTSSDSRLELTPHPDWGTGMNLGYMREVYEFEYEMDECLSLHDGYISITGLGEYPECVLWLAGSYENSNPDTPGGDGAHCGQPGVDSEILCGRYWNKQDLAIELIGPEVTGACCDDVAGTCAEVMPDECLTGRFEPGVPCAELDPPCGGLAGACCSEDDPCYLSYEADCEEAYAGDGSTCDSIDCNSNGTCDACDIALGTSLDCNGNGTPDECDIAMAASNDYNQNSVPDECDPDRNENGVPDACDIDCDMGNCQQHPIGCGSSMDCQGDGVPDDAQLGTMGSSLIRNNGTPEFHELEEIGASQEGGEWEHALVLDDFIVPTGGTEINTITFHTETSEDFEWTGRVRVRVHANRGFWSPEGAAWQVDGDPNRTLVDVWVPDDGGTVTRTENGEGATFDRYIWTISDIAIPLEAGPYFISFAPEADGEDGYSLPCFSNVETLEWNTGSIYRSEAWARRDLSSPFSTLETFEFAGVDIAFVLTTNMYGQDDNSNGVPDECEAGPISGDVDGDGDVDLSDFALFSNCLAGPGVETPPAECTAQEFSASDLDHDSDVDLQDFNEFQGVFGSSCL